MRLYIWDGSFSSRLSLPAFAARTACLAFLLLPVLAGTGFAQSDPAAGLNPFSTRVGDVYDSLDLSTSNIFVRIPVRNKAGKIPFSYSLVMNSHASGGSGIWVVSGGLTGQLSLGPPQLRWQYYTPTCPGCTAIYLQNFYIVDSTGAQHALFLAQTDYLCSNGTAPATMAAYDGSGYSVSLNGFQQNTCDPIFTIYDKSGNAYAWQGNAIQDLDGALITLNTVTSTNSSGGAYTNTTTYTDTLGQIAMVMSTEPSTAPGSTAADDLTYTDAAGQTQTFQVNYSLYTQETTFGCLNAYRQVVPK